jgi:hypothetical protein
MLPGRRHVGAIDVELVPSVGDADQDRLVRCEELFEDFCIVTASVRQGIAVNVSIKEPEHAGVTAAPPALALAVEPQDDQC